MTRARYHEVAWREGFVWIVDDYDPRSPSMTVTNDAEAVVVETLERNPGCRIFYRDSEGEWAELLHDGGEFTNFAPCPPQFVLNRSH